MRQAQLRYLPSVMSLVLTGMWLLMVGVSGVAADDDESFSNRSLRGAYGFIASGTLNDNAAIGVGRYTFHGNGTCSLVTRVNIAAAGGTEPIDATSCTYEVQSDGTGTITLELPGFGTFNFAFVIIDNKKELQLITLDPGVSATVVVKKQ